MALLSDPILVVLGGKHGDSIGHDLEDLPGFAGWEAANAERANERSACYCQDCQYGSASRRLYKPPDFLLPSHVFLLHTHPSPQRGLWILCAPNDIAKLQPPSVKSESCSLSSTFSLPPPPPELSTPHRPSLELRQPPELSLPRRTSLSLYTSSTSLPSPAVSFSTPHRPSLSLHLTDLLSHYTSPTFSLSTPHRPLFSLYTSPTFPPLAGLRLDAGILEIGDIVGCAQYLEFPLHAWVRIPLPHHRL